MVSSELRTGLYVSVPVYFVLLGLATYWAHRHIQATSTTNSSASSSSSSSSSNHLKTHYLGGQDFGAWLTAGTVFASLFSGYTVVGIPGDGYYAGFLAFLWVPATIYIIAGYALTGIRFKKASMVRHHYSPVDFVTDRFESQVLRFTIVFIQVISSFIYLAAQVNALKSTFNAMYGVSDDTNWPVIFIMFLILGFEWFGGLKSVALTDAVQGFIMLIFFILIPVVIKVNFGGWADLDPGTDPRPDFYQTPTTQQQVRYWQFCLLFSSYFTLPHLLQRIYSAQDLASLRTSWTILTFTPWAAMFVGVFIGTVGVQILADANVTVEYPTSPFTAILEQVMLLGGFAKGVGVIAFTASLAAIMSTTDSLVIAVSHLITVEIMESWRPAKTEQVTFWRARFSSFLTAALALMVGIIWKSGISKLAEIQFPCTMQAVPTFLVGLYASESLNFHPWSLAMGALISIVYVLSIFFGYLATHPEVPLDSGVTGVVLNVASAMIFEIAYRVFWRPSCPRNGSHDDDENNSIRKLIHPGRPDWDVPNLDRFGQESLTPTLLNGMMTGVKEHARSGWYVLLIFLSVTMVMPWEPSSQPPMDEETGDWIVLPVVVRGIPWWVLKQILLCIIPYVILLVTILQMPKEYPDIAGYDQFNKSSTTARLLEEGTSNNSEMKPTLHQTESLLSSKNGVTTDDRNEDDDSNSGNPPTTTTTPP